MATKRAGDRIRFNRLISWALVVVAIGTILTGYLTARGLVFHIIIAPYHLVFEMVFILLFSVHLILSLLTKFYWKNTAQKIRTGTASSLNWLKLLQRITGFIIVAAAFLVILAGLDWYGLGLAALAPFPNHLNFDIFLTLLAIVHVVIGARFALARPQIRGSKVNAILLLALLIPTLTIGLWDLGGFRNTMPPPIGTQPTLESDLVWVGATQLSFNPTEVETLRPDLFK
ncbi:MAG: hypothetical protein ACXACH_02290, partial [Candidatus Hermodarchaeia archaeon]